MLSTIRPAPTAWLLAMAFIAGLLWPAPVKADSWAMPKSQSYESASKDFRLTVTPAEIGSQLRYFERKVAEEQGRAEASPERAIGRLERRRPDGSWETIWMAQLLNEVAPVLVLVADDGQRVVTLDDWHAVGTGSNAVAIYDEAGQRLARYALRDLVPDEYARALPRSVSSIDWRNDARIDHAHQRLVVDLLIPGSDETDTATLPLSFDLSDGSLVRPPADSWAKAIEAAGKRVREMQAAEQARLRFLIEPLSAPSTADRGSWYDYLREAFYRLTPVLEENPVPSVHVLPNRKDKDYREARAYLREQLADEIAAPFFGLVVASPEAPGNLIAELRGLAGKTKPSDHGQAVIYLAIPESLRADAQAAVQGLGAKIVWIDPASAIPQRAERIPGSAEEARSQEAAREHMIRQTQESMKELERLTQPAER